MPWRIVPEERGGGRAVSIDLAGKQGHGGSCAIGGGGTILKLDCYCLVLTFHEKPRWIKRARSARVLDCSRGENSSASYG